MKKRLSRIGNSLGIVLDRPLLERVGIDEKTEIEISTDGSVIVLSPKRNEKRDARLRKIAGRVFDEYAGAFRKLAE